MDDPLTADLNRKHKTGVTKIGTEPRVRYKSLKFYRCNQAALSRTQDLSTCQETDLSLSGLHFTLLVSEEEAEVSRTRLLLQPQLVPADTCLKQVLYLLKNRTCQDGHFQRQDV